MNPGRRRSVAAGPALVLSLMLWPARAEVPEVNSAEASGEAGSNKPDPPAAAIRRYEVVASGRQLDVRTPETVALTSALPAAARETLVVKDGRGTIVRTLVDSIREPGRYRDEWDGFGGDGARLPDGQYFWVALFSGEGVNELLDYSAEHDGDAEVKSHPGYSAWNPFENQPLVVRHSFERPGEITIVFARETYYVTLGCDAPKFCRFVKGFQPAGEFVYEWAGVDDTGARREDIHGILVVSSHERLARNGIVVHGGGPAVRDLQVAPAVFSPGMTQQEISFSLRAFPGEKALATVTVTNQESRSVLAVLRAPGLQAGEVRLFWDGRGENEVLVAPGAYTIRVVATSALGETGEAEILTRVEY